MFRNFCIVLMILTAALLFFGCSERESNIVKPNYDIRDGFTGVYTHPGGHLESNYLAFTMFTPVRKVPSVNLKVYAPPDYATTGGNYPVLYLLSPFRGNDFYYFNHGLVAIADKMISEGTIKPMIIVCIDGSAGYGGIFYGNTWYGGKYAEAIGSKTGDPISGSIVDYIDAVYNTYDQSRDTRAISGFEMGGYGAVRIAAMYPENFSSVSAISAPLDFDGAGGTGGFVPLFKQVIRNASGGADHLSLVQYRDLDTAYANPLRTMIMAASCAFSPHMDFDNIITLYPPISADTFFVQDTLTYLNPEGTIKFHLPFDTAGNIRPVVWDMWLANNAPSIIANNPGCYDDMNVKLFTTNDDEYNFNVQTINFASWLQGHLATRGVIKDLTPDNFEGYENYVASGGRFLYDILPVILKYHSDHFPDL